MNPPDYLASLFGQAGRVAVVTGASSGLGAEMAKILAGAGGKRVAARLTQQRAHPGIRRKERGRRGMLIEQQNAGSGLQRFNRGGGLRSE